MKRLIVSLAAVLATACCIAVPAASASDQLGCCDTLHVWVPILGGSGGWLVGGTGEVTGTVAITAIEVCDQYENANTGNVWTIINSSCYVGPPGTHDRSVVYSATGPNVYNYIVPTCFETWDKGWTSGTSTTNTSQPYCD